MADRVDMKQPFSESVVQVAAESVEAFKAAGWTEAKAPARKTDNK
jgi:hypothetical protein